MNRELRLYLDSNVFDHVLAVGEDEHFEEWLRRNGHSVLLSQEHLHEAMAIPDSGKRRAMISLMTGVPRDYSDPSGFLHANEVLNEVRRLRQPWLRRFPNIGRISYWLSNSKRQWVVAKQDPDRFAELFGKLTRPVAEDGIATVREAQKSQREARLAGIETSEGFTLPGGYVVVTPQAPFDDAELWWRRGCLVIWHNALFFRPEAMRDYYDYLSPYLFLSRIETGDFVRFWLSDADREALRRNATVSLLGRAQLRGRITHGNAIDAIHATYLFSCDCLITADRGFFDALTGMPRSEGAAVSVLAHRSAPSAVDELNRVLADVDGS